MVSITEALLSLHRGTGVRDGPDSLERSPRVRSVHVRHVHRTRGSRVSGQVFVVITTTRWEKKSLDASFVPVSAPWRLLRVALPIRSFLLLAKILTCEQGVHTVLSLTPSPRVLLLGL